MFALARVEVIRLLHQAGLQGVPGSEELEEVGDQAGSFFQDSLDAAPRVGIGLAVVVVVWLIAKLVRHLLEKHLLRTRTVSFAHVMAKLAGWGVVTTGVVIAVTIAFPSIEPVDIIAGLGVVSIAAGFAFQDIFSNLLSGLLLILRQPFVAGDQIEVGTHQGTVEGITIRETSIMTFDGRRILIPNRDVYQNAIEIQTAHPSVRTELVVGCEYGSDLGLAAQTALSALRSTDGVHTEPAPEACFIEFGDSSIDLGLYWWSDPRQAEVRHVRHRVVMSVTSAFDQAGLSIPFPIRTLDPSDALSRLFDTDEEGARDESR